MSWEDDIAGIALEIVKCDDPRIRIMAGPGTGKSYSMRKRVERLISEGVDPKRILVATFTRTAAADLKSELAKLGVSTIDATTIHSYSLSLLRRERYFDFSGRRARPLLKSEEQLLIYYLAHKLPHIRRQVIKKALDSFSAGWARNQEDIVSGNPTTSTEKEIYREMLRWLTYHEAMLIGEIIPSAYKYLYTNPNLDELSRFDHVIVDEYQDLNKVEQILIDILSQNSSLMIMGDVDQSIYGFKFAFPEGIIDFENRHTVKDFMLTECRRCAKNIVSIARATISNNPELHPRQFNALPTNADGEVSIVQWKTIDEEVRGVAEYIKLSVEENRYVVGDFLVLSPRTEISNMLKAQLDTLGISSIVFASSGLIIENRAIQESLAYHNLLINPDDRVSLRLLLGGEEVEDEYSHIYDLGMNSGKSPRDILNALIVGEVDDDCTKSIQMRYLEISVRLQELSDLKTDSLVLDELYPPGNSEMLPIRSIFENLEEQPGIDTALELIMTELTRSEPPDNANYVRIMTPHKSKGLGSKIVILMDCIEGFLPRVDAALPVDKQQRILEEQRRLFYVALTRAKEQIVVSYASSIPTKLGYKLGASFNRKNKYVAHTIASRFVGELGMSAPSPVVGSEWLEKYKH